MSAFLRPAAGGLAAFLAVLSAAGCAAEKVRSDYDPLEDMNRGVFWFNEKADRYVLEPVAKGYDSVVPDPAERAISRFFANLLFPVNFLNNLLQGKPLRAGGELGRFVVNTTVGVAGFFDPATSWGLEAHPEDLGQTLGTWGVPPGPYLVLPFIGPSNPRDTVGLVVDYAARIYPFYLNALLLNGVAALEVVNLRSRNLELIDTARAAALDYYVFVRDAYFQNRQSLVRDGAVEQAPQDEDLYDVDAYDDEP